MVGLRLLLVFLIPFLVSGASDIPTAPSGNDVCLDDSSIPAVTTTIDQNLARTDSEVRTEKKHLPVIFFHGITGDRTHGANIEANLTAEGRPFVALSFCEKECSIQALKLQVPMAIAAVRDVVAKDKRFADGYIFIAHSQGGLLARSVIEEMDDHKVHTFVSLAGAHNGIFYGPQDDDRMTTDTLLSGFGAQIMPSNLFDFTQYSGDGLRGKMQHDWARRSMDSDLQVAYSFTNLARTPVRDVWLNTNAFLPMINNVKKCSWYDIRCRMDKIRRKNNFLRLKEAHFFASPKDGFVAPWQISVFGHYSEVNSLEEIESKFEDFSVVEMHDTVEYKKDTFGLRTLDERGDLFRYTAPDVHHICWLEDFSYADGACKFAEVYDQYVYKVIS